MRNFIFVFITVISLLLVGSFFEGKNCFAEEKNYKVFRAKEEGIVKDYVEKFRNPIKYESTIKSIIKSFFTGPGLRIVVGVQLFLSLFFFFRVRNYIAAIFFYILANIFVYFGPSIANYFLR